MGVVNTSTTDSNKNVESQIAKCRGVKLPQFIAGLTVGVAAFCFGTVAGWMSPSQPQLQSSDRAVGDSRVTDEEASWLGSLVFIGALIASPIFSFICQKFGRKPAGYISVIPVILSWLIIIFTNSIALLYIARFLGGVTTGAVVVFFPMYASEIAQDEIRGALGTFLTYFCNIGILFTYAIGPFVSFKMLSAVCLVPPLLFLIGFYKLPETPIYLLTKGRVQDAEKSLLWLRGGNLRVVEDELQNMKELVQGSSASEKISKKDLLLSKGTKKAIAISLVVCISQHLSGVYAIINYANDIFTMSGTTISPDIASIYIALLQILGSFLSSFFIDYFGRRILLICSQLFMTLSLLILGAYMYFQQQGVDLEDVSILPIGCLALYLFSLAAGLGPVTFVLISEIFHPYIRSFGLTLATLTIWTLAFIVTKFYPTLTNVLGIYGCFWLFAGVCFTCTVFCILQIPETKNRSVDSILRELNGDSSVM